jgi:hypothetical protein
MVEYQVVPAEAHHAANMAPRMRQCDIDEAWAAAHYDPFKALMISKMVSRDPMACLADGQTVWMFGVGQRSPFSRIGNPWMLAAEGLEKHSRVFLRMSVNYVKEIKTWYDLLENHVDARNEKTVKWLKWLGYTIDDPEPFGVEGFPFHRFQMER